MSKSSQRRVTIIGLGRRAGIQGLDKYHCPYIHPAARSLWYEGWEIGREQRARSLRESKRVQKKLKSQKKNAESRFGRFLRKISSLFHR